MNLKLPEETLMKLGFRLLDITYGELTINKGKYYNESFNDKIGVGRLGYNKSTSYIGGSLGYIYNDREFFLSIIPVDVIDYERVLKDWMLERYGRKVGTTFDHTHHGF